MNRLVVSKLNWKCAQRLSCRAMSDDKLTTTKVESQPPPDTRDFMRRHEPNNLERRILVWVGKYKSQEEIPPTVPIETIEKARNQARIRISNILIVVTAIACFFVARSGRQAAERGETVMKQNLEWHKSIREEEKERQRKSAE